MPTLRQAGPSLDFDPALLERARLALQSLKFEEQAARSRAAYASLLEAIAEAESGNAIPLRQWLDERSSQLSGERAAPTATVTSQKSMNAVDTSPVAPEVETSPAAFDEGKLIRVDAAHGPPTAVSPWDLMHRSALERAIYWIAPTGEVSSPQTSCSPLLESIADGMQGNPNRKRKPWWSLPHVYVSLILHAILIVAFSVWVIANVQNPLVLSLVAGTVESEDVLADTPLEMPTTLEQSLEDSPSIPSVDSISAPVELPSITAADLGVGPKISDMATSTNTGQSMLAAAAGTKFVEGAEFFGSKAVGNTFVFIIDCSPSMLRDGAFDMAKSEILKSLSLLKPKQRYFVSFFGKEIIPMQFRGSDREQFAVRASPENLEKTFEWIQRVPIQKDGRPPIDAIVEAIAMQPDGIFLLFDGDTKVDRWTSKIQERNLVDGFLSDGTPKVPIHVVHFFREEFEREMRTLAADNGGSYRFIPRPQKPNRGLK